MFVAEQPSSRGHFPSLRDKEFWDIAVSVGLAKGRSSSPGFEHFCYEGPYVTELVPQRATRSEAEDLRYWGSSKWVPGLSERTPPGQFYIACRYGQQSLLGSQSLRPNRHTDRAGHSPRLPRLAEKKKTDGREAETRFSAS
jgi:hypothetical protein